MCHCFHIYTFMFIIKKKTVVILNSIYLDWFSVFPSTLTRKPFNSSTEKPFVVLYQQIYISRFHNNQPAKIKRSEKGKKSINVIKNNNNNFYLITSFCLNDCKMHCISGPLLFVLRFSGWQTKIHKDIHIMYIYIYNSTDLLNT